jgi:hypothetical protein
MTCVRCWEQKARPHGRKSHFVAGAVAVALASCTPSKTDSSSEVDSCIGSRMESPCPVSLVNLVARPEVFTGRRVRVAGVLSLDFEGTGLFLSDGDRIYRVRANAIWLSLWPIPTGAKEQCHGRYAEVTGTFDAHERGHGQMWSGGITAVDRIMRLPEARSTETYRVVEGPDRVPDVIPDTTMICWQAS